MNKFRVNLHPAFFDVETGGEEQEKSKKLEGIIGEIGSLKEEVQKQWNKVLREGAEKRWDDARRERDLENLIIEKLSKKDIENLYNTSLDNLRKAFPDIPGDMMGKAATIKYKGKNGENSISFGGREMIMIMEIDNQSFFINSVLGCGAVDHEKKSVMNFNKEQFLSKVSDFMNHVNECEVSVKDLHDIEGRSERFSPKSETHLGGFLDKKGGKFEKDGKGTRKGMLLKPRK